MTMNDNRKQSKMNKMEEREQAKEKKKREGGGVGEEY